MDKFFDLLAFLITVVTVFVIFGIFLGFPAWLLYKLIAPIFGPDPIGHVGSIISVAIKIFAVSLGLSAVVVIVGHVYDRFKFVRRLFAGLAYTFVILLVISSLTQCFSANRQSCSPSRYIEC